MLEDSNPTRHHESCFSCCCYYCYYDGYNENDYTSRIVLGPPTLLRPLKLFEGGASTTLQQSEIYSTLNFTLGVCGFRVPNALPGEDTCKRTQRAPSKVLEVNLNWADGCILVFIQTPVYSRSRLITSLWGMSSWKRIKPSWKTYQAV